MSKTFIDFFAGIGGFRRGMELAGHRCVGFCEFDKFAVMSYKMMHTVTEKQREHLLSLSLKDRQKEIAKEDYLNGEWYANDVRTVDARSMPRTEVWCFGFPCQDISVAGKQLGFDGKRSSLFFAVTRIIRDTREEDRPSTLFIENVKNLLSVNGGIDFLKLLIELDEIGYDAEWQLLNSKDFGVPQNRERVFVVGHLRGRSRREVFPIERSNKETSINVIGTTAPNPYDSSGNIIRDKATRNWVYDSNGLMCTLSATDYKQPKQILLGNINLSGTGMNGQVYSPKRLAPTLNTNKEEGNKIAIPVLTPDRLEKRQNGRRFKEDGEEMFTLTAQDRHGVMVREATKQGYAIAESGDSINLEQPNSQTRRGRVGKGVAQTLTTSCNQATLDGMRIRKLIPRECFRLQGWEDKYFNRAASINSDSQLYKEAGNGVTVTVINVIADKL